MIEVLRPLTTKEMGKGADQRLANPFVVHRLHPQFPVQTPQPVQVGRQQSRRLQAFDDVNEGAQQFFLLLRFHVFRKEDLCLRKIPEKIEIELPHQIGPDAGGLFEGFS